MKVKSTLHLVIIIFAFTLKATITNGQDNVVIDYVNYKASYLYTYQEDSSSTDKVNAELMALYIGDYRSKFEHYGSFSYDSIVRVYSNHPNKTAAKQLAWKQVQTFDSGSFLTSLKVVKNKENNTTIFHESSYFMNGKLKVTEKLDFDWQLVTNSDTIICNYQCLKATVSFKGRNYQAWYSPEIPISDGPYKFKGLPGLIIKIQDDKNEHCFELEAFYKVNTAIPIYFDENRYTEVSMEKYYKTKKVAAMSILELLNSQSANHTNTDMGEVEAKILSKNNFIERL